MESKLWRNERTTTNTHRRVEHNNSKTKSERERRTEWTESKLWGNEQTTANKQAKTETKSKKLEYRQQPSYSMHGQEKQRLIRTTVILNKPVSSDGQTKNEREKRTEWVDNTLWRVRAIRHENNNTRNG